MYSFETSRTSKLAVICVKVHHITTTLTGETNRN